MLTNETYDNLRIWAQLILPIGTFLAAIMTIWAVPHADQVMATFSALDVLAGAIVTVAKAKWDKEHGDAGE